jgi:hypothetical protein
MQTQDQPQHAPVAQAERPEHVDVLVIGAGQAGLAVGWHLREEGIRSFLLLDAGPEVGHVWRSRWDSLRLFTPAEYDALPGMPSPPPPARTRPRTRSRTTCVATPPRSSCRSSSTLASPGSPRPVTRSAPTPPAAPSRLGRSSSRPGRSRHPSSQPSPATLRPTSSSCTLRTTATPTSCPTARSWLSAPATQGCRLPPSSPPPGPSPSRSGPDRRCCRSGSSAVTCSGG